MKRVNIMTGKKLPYQCVEVVVKLKAPPVKLYDGEVNDRIVMRLQARPHLDIRIDIKSFVWSDLELLIMATHDYPQDSIDGHEKLLYDAINLDLSLAGVFMLMESWNHGESLMIFSALVTLVPFALLLTSILVDGDHGTKFCSVTELGLSSMSLLFGHFH